jgi:hypothetical protein
MDGDFFNRRLTQIYTDFLGGGWESSQKICVSCLNIFVLGFYGFSSFGIKMFEATQVR